MLSKQSFFRGVLLSSFTVGLAWVVAVTSYESNLYYLAQVLPFMLTLYVLIAWFIWVRRDRADLQDRNHRRTSALEDSLQPLDASGDQTEVRQRDPFWRETFHTLLWAAGILAVTTVVLYQCFGIGSTYYLQ